MSYTQLTRDDRIRMGVLRQQGKTPTEIAELIKKHRSSVYRELTRNSCESGYFPETAQLLATQRRAEAASMPRIDDEIKKFLKEKILLKWSPEQISERMKIEYQKTLSHEWIYQLVYQDKKNGGTLFLHLRWGRKTRKKRAGGRDKRGEIPNRVSIEQRPEVVARRIRIGDLEGDTVIGANHQGKLLTLVDRTSRLALLEKLTRKSAKMTTRAVLASLGSLTPQWMSITFDNGKEFAAHEQITKTAGIAVYFAHPYSSYERGTNENTNGLIRQYFPKKCNLSRVSKVSVKEVQNSLNYRPRKVLGFKLPTKSTLARSYGTLNKDLDSDWISMNSTHSQSIPF